MLGRYLPNFGLYFSISKRVLYFKIPLTFSSWFLCSWSIYYQNFPVIAFCFPLNTKHHLRLDNLIFPLFGQQKSVKFLYSKYTRKVLQQFTKRYVRLFHKYNYNKNLQLTTHVCLGHTCAWGGGLSTCLLTSTWLRPTETNPVYSKIHWQLKGPRIVRWSGPRAANRYMSETIWLIFTEMVESFCCGDAAMDSSCIFLQCCLVLLQWVRSSVPSFPVSRRRRGSEKVCNTWCATDFSPTLSIGTRPTGHIWKAKCELNMASCWAHRTRRSTTTSKCWTSSASAKTRPWRPSARCSRSCSSSSASPTWSSTSSGDWSLVP